MPSLAFYLDIGWVRPVSSADIETVYKLSQIIAELEKLDYKCSIDREEICVNQSCDTHSCIYELCRENAESWGVDITGDCIELETVYISTILHLRSLLQMKPACSFAELSKVDTDYVIVGMPESGYHLSNIIEPEDHLCNGFNMLSIAVGCPEHTALMFYYNRDQIDLLLRAIDAKEVMPINLRIYDGRVLDNMVLCGPRVWCIDEDEGQVYPAHIIHTMIQKLEYSESLRELYLRRLLPNESLTNAEKHMRNAIPEAIKQAVFQRDGGVCCSCGSDTNLEFDHVIPLSKGGADSVGNLQVLCLSCNRAKGSKI